MAAEFIYLLKEQRVYVKSSIEFFHIERQEDLHYLPVESVGIARYMVLKKNIKILASFTPAFVSVCASMWQCLSENWNYAYF